MTDTAKATHISQVGTVFVPVADQERALAFYLDKLGFEKRADFPYGGGRWIEVAPPGSANAIALVARGEGTAGGADRTYCAFATTDIETDHATLRAKGVEIDAEVGRKGTSRTGLFSVGVFIDDPMPPQVCFRDVDGNRFLLVEPS